MTELTKIFSSNCENNLLTNKNTDKQLLEHASHLLAIKNNFSSILGSAN